jgi:hypothetical protein
MPVFARLYKPQPIPLFETTWKHSRQSLGRAYLAAFEAAERRNVLLDDLLRVSDDARLAAYAEDIAAHQQAGTVLLAADDALQRLGKALQGIGPGVDRGFGPTYRDVPLTALLRAATNAIRHASEWDDDADRDDEDSQKLHFPYNDPRNDGRKALKSIRILQKVLGYGVHERIHIAPSFDVLALIDGSWYSGKTPAEFSRFDTAVQAAAADIMQPSGAEVVR